jgi:hypothetical protein
MHIYIKEIYKKEKTSRNWWEDKLQPTFTPGWINHPGLKMGQPKSPLLLGRGCTRD